MCDLHLRYSVGPGLCVFKIFLTAAILSVPVLSAVACAPARRPAGKIEESADRQEVGVRRQDAYYAKGQGQVQVGGGVFGRSVEGRPMRYVRFGEGEDIVLVIGAIHGDEPASEVLARGLVRWLEERSQFPPDIAVIVVPAANPDGLAANRRVNVNGVDLNRNFPSENRQNTALYGYEALSEPEAMALYELMKKYPPDRIISIHSPLGCVDYDGPARGMAEAMAERCDLPVRKLGARPGSFGSYAGVDSGIPIVTFELLRDDKKFAAYELWEIYGDAILAGVSYGRDIPLDE